MTKWTPNVVRNETTTAIISYCNQGSRARSTALTVVIILVSICRFFMIKPVWKSGHQKWIIKLWVHTNKKYGTLEFCTFSMTNSDEEHDIKCDDLKRRKTFTIYRNIICVFFLLQ